VLLHSGLARFPHSHNLRSKLFLTAKFAKGSLRARRNIQLLFKLVD
jgi:hypothetical protein